jgi:hypothetical protein
MVVTLEVPGTGLPECRGSVRAGGVRVVNADLLKQVVFKNYLIDRAQKTNIFNF